MASAALETFSESAIPEEPVPEKEMRLAAQLKSFCALDGKEQRSTLSESAAVLTDLGKFYEEKAVKSKVPMHQKLAFIRSFALLNAAKVRFETLKDDEGVARVMNILTDVSNDLYDSYKVASRERSLPEISKLINDRLTKMRQEEISELEDIPQIADSKKPDVSEMELRIIRGVHNLYLKTTENYTNLMKKVTEECIRMIGSLPCRFCQVGLGSIARKEITLYSDFEHVIILENGVMNLSDEDYDKVFEYFRWFAVFFQIIIIGFGETFVRSVGVKSINDLYSDDPSKNWYFDVFTPCGVAFDGMVPHSCMNPLGRQNKTKNRLHKVEFIQPASKMANYLSSEQHMKNGYYIKDILTRTCLVYGDPEVYECFVNESRKILKFELMLSIAKDQTAKITANVNQYIRGSRMGLNKDPFDPKVTFYRPITALLAYFGRFFDITTSSSSDIIDELEKMGVLDGKVAHKLRYAVAAACIMRMKAYQGTGHQRQEGRVEPVLGVLGNHDAPRLYKVMRYLVVAVHSIVHDMSEKESKGCREVLSALNVEFWKENDTVEEIFELVESGQFRQAVDLGEEHTRTLKKGPEFKKLVSLLAECYFVIGENYPDEKEINWTKAKAACEELAKYEDLPDGPHLDCLYIMEQVSKYYREYETGIGACREWFKHHHRMKVVLERETRRGSGVLQHSILDITVGEHKHQYPMVLRDEIDMRMKHSGATKSIAYFFCLLSMEEIYDARFTICYAIAKAELEMEYHTLAREAISQLIGKFIDDPNKHKNLRYLLEEIVELKNLQGWTEDKDVIARILGKPSGASSTSHRSEQRSRSLHKQIAVGLATSAMLVEENAVRQKVEDCINICQQHPRDDDMISTYAHVLSVCTIRIGASMKYFDNVMSFLSAAPKSVIGHKLLNPVLPMYIEDVFEVYLDELKNSYDETKVMNMSRLLHFVSHNRSSELVRRMRGILLNVQEVSTSVESTIDNTSLSDLIEKMKIL